MIGRLLLGGALGGRLRRLHGGGAVSRFLVGGSPGGSSLRLLALGGRGALGRLLLGGAVAGRLGRLHGGSAVGRFLLGGALAGRLRRLHGGGAVSRFLLRRFLGSRALRGRPVRGFASALRGCIAFALRGCIAFALRGRSLRGGGVLGCALVGERPGLGLRLVALLPRHLLHLLSALLRRRLLPRLLARHDLRRLRGDLRAALRVAALDAQEHGAHAAAAVAAGGVCLPQRSLRSRPRLDEGDLVAAVALHLARRGGRSARVACSGAGRGKVDGQRCSAALAGAAPHRSRRGEKSRVLRVLDVNGTLTVDRNGNALGSWGTYSALRSLHRRNDSLFLGDGAHEGGRECQRAVPARREAGAPCGLR